MRSNHSAAWVLQYFNEGLDDTDTCSHIKVYANGGVLRREDIRDYSVEVEQPVESLLNGEA